MSSGIHAVLRQNEDDYNKTKIPKSASRMKQTKRITAPSVRVSCQESTVFGSPVV